MKNIAIILVCALAYCFGVQAQSSIPHSQAGFDVEKTGIAQGKIETVAMNWSGSIMANRKSFSITCMPKAN